MHAKLPPTRRQRRFTAFLHDCLAIPIAWLAAYWLRFNLGHIPDPMLIQALWTLPFLVLIQEGAYLTFGLYRGIWRFASVPDLLRIIKAVFLGTAITMLLTALLWRMQYVPRSVFPIYALLLIGILGGSRLVYRSFKTRMHNSPDAQRVLIIGAGQAGDGLIRNLLSQTPQQYTPVGVVDDAPSKQGREIHGVRVLGYLQDIVKACEQYSIELIFIALPSASTNQLRQIINACEKTGLPFRILPSLTDLASGKVSINALREVTIEDLLGRDQVSLNWQAISAGLTGKTVLVSGGGGSIGSELCRQIAKLKPAHLLIFENSEFNLYSIDLELRKNFPELLFDGFLVDVTDEIAVTKLLTQYRPTVIFHAAAYKHVPLLESQIRIAMRNNILGTWILAQQAVRLGAQQFTLISTDKAVNPTNIMGATKRAAEIICQNLSAHSQTHFITVRFGNVLGSAGSVVPLFRSQIAAGGPVTITHPDITRYFMTIPEATQLIMQATVMGKGGEIFVLDMGSPIKISYLAEQMIQLAGLRVGEDIEIKYTGLRPGEKLFEELFYENEELIKTEHEKIRQARHGSWDWEQLTTILQDIKQACELYDEPKLHTLLHNLVSEYKSQPLRCKTSTEITVTEK